MTIRAGSGRRSFSHNFENQLAGARPVVEIHEHELLPGSEHECGVGKRDGQAGLQQRRPDV